MPKPDNVVSGLDTALSGAESVAIEVTTGLEIGLLLGGASVLIWAATTGKEWNTISHIVWRLRDRWGVRSALAVSAGLTAGLGWVWWHLIFDG